MFSRGQSLAQNADSPLNQQHLGRSSVVGVAVNKACSIVTTGGKQPLNQTKFSVGTAVLVGTLVLVLKESASEYDFGDREIDDEASNID